MIITCPSCKKKFVINENLIPDNGRMLKCGSCNQTWFFKKDEKVQTTQKSTTSEQKIIFSTGGDMVVSNCKFRIDQSSEAKVKCMVDSVQTAATDISNDISEQLKSYSDRTIDQSLEGLGMGSNIVTPPCHVCMCLRRLIRMA